MDYIKNLIPNQRKNHFNFIIETMKQYQWKIIIILRLSKDKLDKYSQF